MYWTFFVGNLLFYGLYKRSGVFSQCAVPACLGALHPCPHATVTWRPWEGGTRQYHGISKWDLSFWWKASSDGCCANLSVVLMNLIWGAVTDHMDLYKELTANHLLVNSWLWLILHRNQNTTYSISPSVNPSWSIRQLAPWAKVKKWFFKM